MMSWSCTMHKKQLKDKKYDSYTTDNLMAKVTPMLYNKSST